MKTTKPLMLFFFLSILICGCTEIGVTKYVSEGNVNNLIEIGNWDKKENLLYGVGNGTYLLTEDWIHSNDFEIEALISLDDINKTGASFFLWGNFFNFDGNSKECEDPVLVLSGELVGEAAHSWTSVSKVITQTNQYLKADVPFQFNVICKDSLVKFYINDKEVYICKNVPDTYGHVGFIAGKAGMNIFDFNVKGSVKEQKKLSFLYKNGESGYSMFRIPAMTVTTKGTVLAFVEGRESGSDTGDIDIVLKRSTDSGKTWSDLQVVLDDAENTCGNPVPVVDSETGTIFLLTTKNIGTDHESKIIDGTSKNTRLVFVQQSDDDGKTWSEAIEITKDVKLDNWTWYATGPCQGIQIKHGEYKGRLVVPCDHIEADTKKYYSHAIYSDDHGKTWKLGGRTPSDMVNECTVAEIAGGKLLLNMRNYDPSQRSRKTSVSEDGGITWSELSSDDTLIEPICQAGMHRYSFADEGRSRLLFLNPAHNRLRTNMTLRISYDDGKSWANSKVLYPGQSAYSDVIRLPNGDIGCFYEAGYINGYEGIVFETVKLLDIETSDKL